MSLFVGLAEPPSFEVRQRRQRRFGGWYAMLGQLQYLRYYWWTELISSVGTPVVYVLAFGAGLGTLMQAQGRQVDGVDYLVFVGPALLINAVFFPAFIEATYPVMGGFKWRGTYFSAFHTGLQPGQLLSGALGVTLVRTTVQALIFLAVLLLAGGTRGGMWWLVIPISMLLTVASFLPMAAYTAHLRSDRGQITAVNRFLVMPLMLFSGTYYPLEVLPGAMQWIGWISPVWHATDLARWASYGVERPVWLLLVHIGYLALMAVIGGFFARREFARRLDQ